MFSKEPPVYLRSWDLDWVDLGEDAPRVHDGQADQARHEDGQVRGAERGQSSLDQTVQRRDQNWEAAAQQSWVRL